MKRHDLLWKGLLEDLFEDFLRFFYPNADELFDMKRGFQYLDKELDQLFPPEGNNYAPSYVDKLVKVFTRGGDEEWMLIHIEVQGYADEDFAKRMFKYYNRIFDQYDRPTTAFALFADSNKSFHPKYYERDFLGTRVYYGYNTYKIIDQDDAQLEATNNPFAMAVLSAKLSLSRPVLKDDQLFDRAYDLAKRLLKKQIPKEKIRTVMTFLRYILHFDKPETITKFVKELRVLTEKSNTMGIDELLLDQAKKEGMETGMEKGMEKGIQKGMEKGELKKAMAVALEMKNEGFPIPQIAKFTKLSTEEIERL